MNAVAQHDELASRRRDNAAWRLLVADNAPLILGFLGPGVPDPKCPPAARPGAGRCAR